MTTSTMNSGALMSNIAYPSRLPSVTFASRT